MLLLIFSESALEGGAFNILILRSGYLKKGGTFLERVVFFMDFKGG